jgi:hypothetical protein
MTKPPYDVWLKQLRSAAVEGFFISLEGAATLSPIKRREWYEYYQEGYGPLPALVEDLDAEAEANEA